jgi:hypothetical protein
VRDLETSIQLVTGKLVGREDTEGLLVEFDDLGNVGSDPVDLSDRSSTVK